MIVWTTRILSRSSLFRDDPSDTHVQAYLLVSVVKQKAPIGSSGCTRTGAKSNFQADRDGALLGYRSREASVKKLPSDLVFILKFFFTGTNLPVGSDLLEPLSGYAKSVSSVVIFTFGLSRFFEMKILRPG
ncbi:hypothetical protein NDU88_005989 [Pleurodeles waltl]|uniref:Uncharacterized protein n=1 Tax=Pleurodeles waltl TaxID=8319 RepID=A0AAV7MCL6_PLEWA|nr:hypothetical protein NDU88_005989 [Pleurodeles waltl]